MNDFPSKIRIGTRGSDLALTQARLVEQRIQETAPSTQTEIVIIKTSGDWKPEDGETRLDEDAGGKGLFAKEIETALLAGEIDCAVHSMKDLDSQMPDRLVINHLLPREDSRDALLINAQYKVAHKLDKIGQTPYQTIGALPPGTRVGTSSVRRAAILQNLNPDLEIRPFRGNVSTRLEKLKNGQVDATILATAGLNRLDLAHEIDAILEVDEMVPAAGQGAIGLQIRDTDQEKMSNFSQFCCYETLMCVACERAALQELDGTCHTPIGAHARLQSGNTLHLRLCVYGDYFKRCFEKESIRAVKKIADARAFGAQIARELKSEIPRGITI